MTAWGRTVARTRLFVQRAVVLGISTRRVLLWELPKLVAWRAYNRAFAWVYAAIDQLHLADRSIRGSLRWSGGAEQPCFCILVVPDVMHLLLPAVRLVHRHTRLVFVLNGASADEARCLRDTFPDVPAVRIWTLGRSSWPHGRALNLLLRTCDQDFGIMDHDFFLFEPAALEQLRFAQDEFAISATAWRNQPTGLLFPGTHLLYLRTSLINRLMRQYGVGAQLYKRLPRRIQALLRGSGLSMTNPPKEYQTFFDSFLLLSALAMIEGLRMRRLVLSGHGFVHIGGTSMGLPVSKDVVHHYVSARFLELLPANRPVAVDYRRRGVARPDLKQTLRQRLAPEIAAQIDSLVERVCAVRARSEG